VRERGLVFLSSAFSLAAIDLLKSIGVSAWKIGSGEFASRELWDAMTATGAPILFSTGLAKRVEIETAVDLFRRKGLPFALFQCTTSYPSPLEEVGLNVMQDLRLAYRCPVGLSDHSGKVFPGLAAIARGADFVEVHVTFDRRMFGPDTPASLTFDEFGLLCGMRDAVAAMDRSPVDKDRMAERLNGLREMFGKSLAPLKPIAAGTALKPDMLTAKKPGGGIPPEAVAEIAGRRLKRDVAPDRILRWSDLVEE
jgi:N-acetylneuraminate synthase